jgi:hypothetical protein
MDVKEEKFYVGDQGTVSCIILDLLNQKLPVAL